MAITPINYPTINGNRYSWASLTFQFPRGVDEPGVKDISFKATVERGKVRGAGRRILGFTRGNLDYAGSMTMLAEEFMNLVGILGDGYMDAVFPIRVGYREGARVNEVKISGVRLGEEDFTHSQSTDGLEVKIKLDYLFYELNGIKHIKGRGPLALAA